MIVVKEELPIDDPAALLSVSDVAERLGVSVRFVRRLVEQRRLSFHKIGKYVRFDPDDLDKWVEECKVHAIR